MFADQPIMKTLCYFSVGLPRTVCVLVIFTLDNIQDVLQQYIPQNTVAKFSPKCFLLLLWKISDQYYHPRSATNSARSFTFSTCQFWPMKRLLVSVKLTTFLTPYEHVLITCCPSFQVFRGSVFYFSLRKHPFLLALRHWGSFTRGNVCDSVTEIPYWWSKSMFT